MTPDGVSALVIAIVSAVFAAGGLVVGIIGLVQASRARGAAGKAVEAADAANGLSREANTIAREANEISKSSAEKAHERHDVRWDAEFVEDGVLAVQNIGHDTAYKVLVRVTFDQEPQCEADAESVPRDGAVQLELSAVREQLLRDRREDATPTPRGVLFVGAPMRMYRLDVEVIWESESGRVYRDTEVGGTRTSLEPS